MFLVANVGLHYHLRRLAAVSTLVDMPPVPKAEPASRVSTSSSKASQFLQLQLRSSALQEAWSLVSRLAQSTKINSPCAIASLTTRIGSAVGSTLGFALAQDASGSKRDLFRLPQTSFVVTSRSSDCTSAMYS